MSASLHRVAGLRRLAASIAMRVLSMLVVVALPLHGISNSVSSIVSPAHYHLAVQLPSLDAEALHDHAAWADHEAPRDRDDPGSRPHGVAEHDEHRPPATEVSSHSHPLETDHDDDRHRPDEGSHHDSLIGHHSHGVEHADVVYLEGDPDRSDLGAAGKHATSSADAALPARSLPIPAIAGSQVLLEDVRLFASRASEPPLRPPSRHERSHA